MKAGILPDLKELHRRFYYDPVLGVLFNKLCNKHNRKVQKDKLAGYLDSKDYLRVKIEGKSYKVHRIIWKMIYREIDPNKQIDHINGIKYDNHVENLRLTTNQENCKNQKLHKNNTSEYSGITFYKKDAIWVARIGVGGKRLYLGSFQTKEDAIAVRKAAEIKYGFHKNHGRGNEI